MESQKEQNMENQMHTGYSRDSHEKASGVFPTSCIRNAANDAGFYITIDYPNSQAQLPSTVARE